MSLRTSIKLNIENMCIKYGLIFLFISFSYQITRIESKISFNIKGNLKKKFKL